MKIFLICRMGLFLLFSQIVFGKNLKEALSEGNLYSITSWDVQECLDSAKENVRQVGEKIVFSPDRPTFANTLRPWNRLVIKFAEECAALEQIQQADLSCSIEASWALQELQKMFFRQVEDEQLYFILQSAATEAMDNCEPLERYIAKRFLANSKKDFLHLQGPSPEKSGSGFTLLSLDEKNFPVEHLTDLVEKISKENPDIISIQKILTEEEIRTLYELLENRYAHFYLYMSPAYLPKKGNSLLLISKYPLQKLQFNDFTNEDVFFDFIIQNKQRNLGHIYAAYLPPGKREEERAVRLTQIIEKIERDFLQEEPMPFILCGELGVVRGSREMAERLLEGSFCFPEDQSGSSYVLYFPPTPEFFHRPDWENPIVTATISLFGNYSGLLTFVKGERKDSIDFFKWGIEDSEEDPIVLCKGKVDLSISTDDEGSTAASGGITIKDEDEKLKGTIDCEVRRDKDGNFNYEGRGKVTYEW